MSLVYTLTFDVQVERRDQLGSFRLEMHDPPSTGQGAAGYHVSIGGTQEQRDRAPRILAKRVRRKASNRDSEPIE